MLDILHSAGLVDLCGDGDVLSRQQLADKLLPSGEGDTRERQPYPNIRGGVDLHYCGQYKQNVPLGDE